MDSKMLQLNKIKHFADAMSTPCEVWRRGAFLHLCFSSVGCRFRKTGHCTMCNYGYGANVSAEEAIWHIDQALDEHNEPVMELLLGTCGSILDEAEMPWNVLEKILRRLAQEELPTIILETHYTTITQQKLCRIRELLPKSEVVIELGFESANPKVLKESLKKYLDLDKLAQTMALIKQANMGVVLNAFLGAPKLSAREQIADTKAAVEWAVSHGADRVVVFPANIKPNTELWDMYQRGVYNRVSHWALIELLDQLDDNLLARVELSWYGDRQNLGKSLDAIPPESCPACNKEIFDFYQEFTSCFDAKKRKKLLYEISTFHHCDCRRRFLESVT